MFFIQGDILSGAPAIGLRLDVAKGHGLVPLEGILPYGSDANMAQVAVRIWVWDGRQQNARIVCATGKLSRTGGGGSRQCIISCKELGRLCDGTRLCGWGVSAHISFNTVELHLMKVSHEACIARYWCVI